MPRRFRMPSVYAIIRCIVYPLVRLLFPAHVVGRENLPKEGPFILAAGPHRTEFESALLACYIGQRQLHFFAKAEYWQGRSLMRRFMDSTGMLPIDRHDKRASARQIERGVEVLQAGGVVALYPEGTRGGDDYLHKGHTGVVRTALQAGNVPIVPVGMIDMRRLNPPGKRLPRPGMSTIIIGEPIYPLLHAPDETPESRTVELAMNVVENDSLLARPVRGVHVRLMTDHLMKEIARLSTARYLDEYLKIGEAGKQNS